MMLKINKKAALWLMRLMTLKALSNFMRCPWVG
jgi:hypothetical protein